MTLLQLEASAQAPCSSTITGLAESPALTAAVLADALAGAAPGAIAIRAAARTAAGIAGRPMRRALRLSDMSVSSLGCVLALLKVLAFTGWRPCAPSGVPGSRPGRRVPARRPGARRGTAWRGSGTDQAGTERPGP